MPTICDSAKMSPASFLLIAGIVMSAMLVGFSQRLHAQGSPLSVDVVWSDANHVSGQLLSMDADALQLRSRIFLDPIAIDRKTINRIIAPTNAVQPIAPSPHRIRLRCESTVQGSILDFDDRRVKFASPRFGELNVPIEQLVAISNRSAMLYEWNGSLAAWKSKDGDKTLEWSVNPAGHLATTSQDAAAWLELNLSRDFELQVALRSQGSLDFAVALGHDVERSIHVSTVGGTVVVGTSDDFEIAATLDETARRFSFRLRWDSIKRTLSLLGSNGLEAVSIREKSETQKNGLLIVNQGKDLEIESLVVTDTVQADSKSTELLNRLRIQATSVKQLSSIVSEGYEIGRDVVRFHDGDMISGSLVGYKEGWFSIRTESLDTTLECSAVGLNRVQMAIGERGDLAEQATLAIGTNRSIGQLRFGNAESPLFWRCTNAKNEARIDIRIPGRVGYFEQRALAIDLSVATDRLYLKNGDVLPCRLDSLRADALSLWTPFSGVVSISSDLVSAVDLGGATRRTEHAFTRESRDTLLTLPRNQRDAPFRQAILAKNGDLLRGNLISVSAKQIEIESRLEPLLIDRDRIASIIFLSLPKTLGDDQKTESDAASDSTSTPESVNRRASGAHDEIRLQFAGGFELNVRVRDVQGNQLVCHSKALGSCLVDLPSIGSVQTGDARSSGELDSFVAWQPIVAASPRWKTTPTETNSLQSLVGTKAPDFELAMLDGKRFRLSEYLGKVVILDFWATWCGPCVKSLPEYLDAMSEFSPSDVMFLGVNATETPDIVRNFISKRNFVGFNTLFDYDGLVSQSMQVTGIPHTVMIAPDGTIAHVHVGYTPTAASEIKALAAKLSQE